MDGSNLNTNAPPVKIKVIKDPSEKNYTAAQQAEKENNDALALEQYKLIVEASKYYAEAQTKIQELTKKIDSQKLYEEAVKAEQDGDYQVAIEKYGKIDSTSQYYAGAQSKVKEISDKVKTIEYQKLYDAAKEAEKNGNNSLALEKYKQIDITSSYYTEVQSRIAFNEAEQAFIAKDLSLAKKKYKAVLPTDQDNYRKAQDRLIKVAYLLDLKNRYPTLLSKFQKESNEIDNITNYLEKEGDTSMTSSKHILTNLDVASTSTLWVQPYVTTTDYVKGIRLRVLASNEFWIFFKNIGIQVDNEKIFTIPVESNDKSLAVDRRYTREFIDIFLNDETMAYMRKIENAKMVKILYLGQSLADYYLLPQQSINNFKDTFDLYDYFEYFGVPK